MFFLNIFGWNSLILLSTLLVALYFYLIRNYKFWSSRGVDGPKPVIFFGTFYRNFSKPIQEVLVEDSRKYGNIYGTYFGTNPSLVVSDPQLIKDMNIKDFHVFVNRKEVITGEDMNDRSLFGLIGDEWKTMRSIISPTFSSGKMRRMHPIIIDCVKRLEKNIEKTALNKDLNEIELKKVMSNLTMDVIATCAFGTDIDVYNEDKTNDFVSNARKVIVGSFRTWMFWLSFATFPKLVKLFDLKPIDPKANAFFSTAIRSIITRRKSEKVKPNDYLQLMIDAQNKITHKEEPEVEGDENQLFRGTDEKDFLKSNKTKAKITDVDIMATSFLFFVAGYETTATLLNFLFYSLAMNEKCQQKLYEEVLKFDGDYSYETIARMPYLEACIAETLRLYNPLPFIERISAEEYILGETGIKIPKGTSVFCNVQAIHHNPDYYPYPSKWDPERFMPENRDLLTPYTYMPFGIGPRNCVGMRFALMEAKTAVAHLVHKFRFFRTANTTDSVKPKLLQFIFTCDNKVGIQLRNNL